MLKEALEICYNAHKNQVDKANKPYILHPIYVALNCETEEQKIVALLHDVVEDTNITLDYLANFFDSKIIEAIRCVTKEEGYDIHEYYQRIKNNEIARVVKMNDLLHNSDLSRLSVITEKDIKRKEKYEIYLRYLKGEIEEL
ncbi:MAG: GTP pyrophosphokinase [Bacilli bacterium]